MPFKIHFPVPEKRVTLFNSKFVVSGEAPRGRKNIVAALKQGDNILASAPTRRQHESASGKLHWYSVFDLESIRQIGNEPYTLVLFKETAGGDLNKEAELPGILFGENIRPGTAKVGAAPNVDVTIMHPSPNNDLCRFSFAPYGMVSPDDTRIQSAVLLDADEASVIAVGVADSDNDGFWWATFDVVPEGNNYSLKVQGNANTSRSANLDFDDC